MNCVGCSIVWGNGSLEIHQQTEAGENVDTIPDLREFAPDKHHERYDGKGYPEGKSGEDIPFIARMICVADSYDAMNTDRVYRKKLSKESIIEELEKGKGTQFDPKIADVMLYLIQNDQLDID